MNGNRFGNIFCITTWGESHGPALGVVIDGCPSGLPLSEKDFEGDMARRRGGNNQFATPREESDIVHVESGTYEGVTTGTPISLRIENKHQISKDYDQYKGIFRPGHADLTTYLKQGIYDHRGGGRASARETAARVAAGVIAKKILAQFQIQICAVLSRAGAMEWSDATRHFWHTAKMEELIRIRNENPLCLPIASESSDCKNIFENVERLRTLGDSWGGAISCRIDHLPIGIGEPTFDKLGAVLGHALLSLPAAVAFESGGGLGMSYLAGSKIRDAISIGTEGASPNTNIHGGLLGGMTTGKPLFLQVGFHAPTSIPSEIETVDVAGQKHKISVTGRHDAFPLPRAVPMVEAMVAITLVDALMRAGRVPEKFSQNQLLK